MSRPGHLLKFPIPVSSFARETTPRLELLQKFPLLWERGGELLDFPYNSLGLVWNTHATPASPLLEGKLHQLEWHSISEKYDDDIHCTFPATEEVPRAHLSWLEVTLFCGCISFGGFRGHQANKESLATEFTTWIVSKHYENQPVKLWRGTSNCASISMNLLEQAYARRKDAKGTTLGQPWHVLALKPTNTGGLLNKDILQGNT